MSVHRGAFVAAVGALLSAGCADLPSAAQIASEAEGTYVLRSAGGRALPATVGTTDLRTHIVESDTLILGPNGAGMHITHERSDYHPWVDFPDEAGRRVSEIRYVVRGTSYEAHYVCPPNANCLPPPHWRGILDSDGVRMVYTLERVTPLLYERVRVPCINCRGPFD